MRHRLSALAAALVLSTGTASAQTITFDPFPSIPAGVTVSYFNNTFGFLGALPTTVTDALVSTSSAIPGGGEALLLFGSGVNGNYGALFSFSAPISFFSAVGNDFGGTNPTDNERIYFTAFNSAGNVVATSIFQAVYANPNLNPGSISNPSISHVAFTFDTDLGYYSVDDIAWRPGVNNIVPEPGTYALLATGLLAVGVMARRRRNA